ncbi:uncharacterized protein C13orf42 homolog [Corvus hawaiiensis]|uniref:uncharacterized protein C13orf42 homolog n=1 Tax=Corvus hawaiiensis TaxID=134902 RepID=UPI002019E484|nr:uncharacterized protein C13orf42 homolog [Corvus hawaiiensis]
MFKKIHSIFHPNSQRRNVTDDIPYCDGSGSAVRLIRSTSMYVLAGEQEKVSEPLKKCRSASSIDSCFQPKEEDRDWMYSKTQDCLKYLQDLLALRKKYLDNINSLKSMHMAADSPASTKSSKTGKKSFLPLPSKESSKASMERKGPQSSSDVREAIAFFDSVIADLDSERWRRVPDMDLPNVDVDFDVATSTSEHSLHSNWILRAPRRYSHDTAQAAKAANQSQRNSQRRTTGSRKRLERHPMYLPKAVEGAYSTLKFKPKTHKKEC